MNLKPPPSFYEFVRAPLTKPRWIVEDMLPGDGWTVLAANAKTGKSLLAMQLAASLSNGSEFLGHVSERRRVLYVQLDAPPGNWQGQLEKGVTEADQHAPATYTREQLPLYVLDDLVLPQLARMIREGKFGLVIWDALEKLTRLDLNTKEGCQTFTDRLRQVHDGASLVLHHLRKPHGDSMEALINAISGNHYLTADASAIWGLVKKRDLRTGKETGALEVITRATPDATIKLDRGPSGLWRLATNTAESPIAKPIPEWEKV